MELIAIIILIILAPIFLGIIFKARTIVDPKFKNKFDKAMEIRKKMQSQGYNENQILDAIKRANL